MSQTPYSGGFWNLHSNGQLLSLLLARTSNLPAQLPPTKTMPELAACRCTPHLIARVPHGIQLWGWISGLQPFLAFNASAPLQKCKSPWKTFYVPILFQHLKGCRLQLIYTETGLQVTADIQWISSIPHPSHDLQRMQWAKGRNQWKDYN